jgi:hypothetical protein
MSKCSKITQGKARARLQPPLARHPERSFGMRSNTIQPRTPLAERFWPKVAKTTPDACWLWLASRTQRYGAIGIGGKSSPALKAHRVSWELHFGPIPPGLHVLHKCDTPKCVNPAHLFLGTQADNVADMVKKGRRRGGNFPGRMGRDRKIAPTQLPELQRRFAEHRETRLALASEFGISPSRLFQLARGWHPGGRQPEWPTGDKNANAKLTPADVRAIRQRAADGERYADIARAFNISAGLVGHIKHRFAWKWLP